MTQEEVNYLLSLPTNSTYNEFTIIGSSCQHIHVPRVTDEEFICIMHIITGVCLFFNCCGIFLILTQTSVTMGRFRWCLLNLQIWTGLTDLMLSLFTIPRFHFPIIGGRSFGLFQSIGLTVPQMVFIGFGTCGGMVASVAVMFLYRQQVVIQAGSLWKMKKSNLVLLIGFNYLLYTTMTWPTMILKPDNQLEVKVDILRREHCPPKSLLHPDTYVLLTSNELWPYAVFLAFFVGIECAFFGWHTCWILFFSTLRANFSRRTRILQIKFFGALVLQVAIPTTLCYCPLIYFFVTTIVDHYWQFANDICVFVFALHGTVSAICLILLYDCYRDCIFYYIGRCFCCCFGTRARVEAIENISAIRSDNSRNALNSYIT